MSAVQTMTITQKKIGTLHVVEWKKLRVVSTNENE